MVGLYPLYWASDKNNVEIMKLLIDYANKNNITLELNKKTENGNYPFLLACYNNNNEMVQLLIDYAIKNNIVLELNERYRNGMYPLYCTCHENNIETMKILIDYANAHNIILELNKSEKNGNYPLLMACCNNNIEMVELLVDYANKNNIILELNKKNENKFYPIYWAFYDNNIEMVQLLLDYANKNNITLKLNGKIENGYYPFYWAFYRNNIEMVQLLIDYANKNNIFLEFNESDYENNSKINPEIIEILKNYKTEKESLLPTLVIATNDFTAQEYYQLDIKKDELLIVTNWNCDRKGYVYGYRKDNKEEKGMFPEVFIKRCKDENKNTENRNSKRFSDITPRYRIEFDKKVKRLRNRHAMNVFNKNLELIIDRKYLFIDAYEQIMNKNPYELKNRLSIKYKGEEGLDAGGLLRDFFYQISQEIGNPNYSLFKYSNTNSYELEINPMSSVNPIHLNYFKFVGRIMGLAIFHKQYISINFTLLFYKKLLNKSLEFSDMEFIDPEVYKNIKWLKENNGVENLGLDFTLITEDCFGNHKTVELMPNGAKIDVTDSNKNEYINLVVKYKLNNINDKEQLNILKQGFYEIIPEDINRIFNEVDLKYLISGFNEIDVDDWERNTDYEGYDRNDITIVHFWKCVREFSNENRIKLLLFATGSSQIPVTGFKDLRGNDTIQHFKLKKIITPDIQNALPISHTCFNRIDLPPYTKYTILKQKLLLAISEGMGGFSLQ